MPEYRCTKCGTDFKKKWSYEYHINRKNPCIGIKEEENESNDIEINDKIVEKTDEEKLEENELKCNYCKKNYSSISNLNKHLKNCKVKINKEKEEEDEKKKLKQNKLVQNLEGRKNIPNKPITIHISKLNNQDNLIHTKNTSIYKEELINDKLKSIYTHSIGIEINNKTKEQNDLNKIEEEENIKENIKNNILKEEYESEFIKELKKEIYELKNIISNQLNNNNNSSVNNHFTFLTQINQNFYINNFGKECVDSIQTDFYFNLLSSPYESVPKLVEEIHFNKQNPYNTNIILPNQNLPFIYVYENGKWVIANKESTLNQLVDKNFERVDDFYEHYKSYLEKTIIEKYEKYSNEFVDTNLKEDIQKDVSTVLERGSQQIIETIIEKRKRPSICEKNIDTLNGKLLDIHDLNNEYNPKKLVNSDNKFINCSDIKMENLINNNNSVIIEDCNEDE